MDELLRADSEAATVVMPARAIEDLPWVPLGSDPGAEHRVLWRSGDSHCGVLRIEAGGAIPAHVHHDAHHHVWVIEGHVETLGQRLGPGSYIHIPEGVAHTITAGPGPATMLYLFLRHHELWNVAGLV
jgi:quercetin dioxygenase-like cupin family protein